MTPTVLFHEPFAIILGWALVHFLWQGTFIAVLLALADIAFQRSGARVRYGLACGAMALMTISVAGTFSLLWFQFPIQPAAPVGAFPWTVGAGFAAVRTGTVPGKAELQAQFARWLPWLDCLWLAGVLVLSARSISAWYAAQRLKTWNTAPVDSIWQERTRRLAQALKVSRPVRVMKSLLARLPAVVGWFRPVILVPAGAFTGLDPQQLEALLAHELAHIRRHDYLVNLIQTAAETLLFYHPAVWWVGRKIRIERENCCDDLAVSACGDVLTYARALTRLEELRDRLPRYVMAAGGGVLLSRIRRLLGAGESPAHNSRTWATGALAALTLCAVWVGAQASSSRQGTTSPGIELTPQENPTAGEKGGPSPRQADAAPSRSWIGDLAAAGYTNLTVDQLVAFKIHGVTPEYITQLRDAGMVHPKPDQLIAFRIHGVDANRIRQWKSAGFAQLTPDQAVALQIHGATPEFAGEMRDLGLGEMTADQLVAMKIHNVTPEFAAEMKRLGLAGMTVDQLVAFRIHGVEGAQLREMQSLGLGTPSADQAVALRIHHITAEFVRGLMNEGLTKIDYDDLIAAGIHGITPDFVQKARKHGFRNLTLDQLIRLKQTGIL